MIHFLTFGAGSQDYLEAVERICNQAKNLGAFSSITGLTDKDLKADTEFWFKHGAFIKRNPRGFGYWIWKPYIIWKTLKSLADGDILLYLDSGCELDISKADELDQYIEHVKTKGMWGTRGSPRDFSNDVSYCKRDTSIKYNLDLTTLQKEHIQGSIHILLRNNLILEFLEEWYEDCEVYHSLNDEPSVEPNFPEFIDHRHDQSIYNLLLKRYAMEDLILYKGQVNLIQIAHNRSGKSRLPQ